MTPPNQLNQRGTYAADTLPTVYDEIAPIQKEIADSGAEIKKLAREMQNAMNAYELAKNRTLIELFKEEAKGEHPKRTEIARQAIYRERNAELRDAAYNLKAALDAEQSNLTALRSQLSAVQSRAGMIKAEMELTRYAT